MDKKELRKNIKNKRTQIDMKSSLLVNKLVETKYYHEAKNIMIFYPMKYEVNLLNLLEDINKNFFLPKVDGNELLCCPYKKGDELALSSFHTKEPLSIPVNKQILDLVIVPALCCDKNNYRLGYGGGFYDRFLQKIKCKTIVCLPQELIVETVYREPHDVKIDIVISV